MQRVTGRGLLLTAFTLSGFAGLIYESLWTHYLKLLLGHAAYAQTLVLAIFMGGLALGSWTCSRRSIGWANLLRAYAVAEAAIGVVALLFHPVFTGVTEAAYTAILPGMNSPTSITLFKWTLGAALIFPQSVILGMTFPMMAGGFIRAYPERPGASLALLYFFNSIGGAIGVLASGFYLVPRLGLPGTSIVAGVINLSLAGMVWLASTPPHPGGAQVTPENAVRPALEPPYRLLILVSLLTGTG